MSKRLPGVVSRAVATTPEQQAELERRASGRIIAHQDVLRAPIKCRLRSRTHRLDAHALSRARDSRRDGDKGIQLGGQAAGAPWLGG